MTETEIKTVGNGNLKPFKPGQCGNPNGRPKKEFSLTEGMREFLSEHDPDKKKLRKDILVEQTYKQAIKGDIAAIKMIFNYLEGMPQGSAPIIPIQVNNYQVTPEDKEAWAVKYLEELGYKLTKE